MELEDYWAEQNEYYDSLPVRYTVYHKGHYYYDDPEDGESWNSVDHDTHEEAFNEYYSLISAGFSEDEVYLKDNHYDVTFSHEEWY